jgi:uncharacterized protein YodC (DUF2158 family)
MKHDYTDEEIKEAENEAFRRKPIAKGHEWVKAFLDALPTRSAEPAEIAALKAALAESEKQFQDKVYEIVRLLDECDKAQGILKACLSVMPFGNIKTHTFENLPGRIADLASEIASLSIKNERLEAELAALRQSTQLAQPILADDGRSLGQVAFDAGNAVQKIKFPEQEIETWEESAEVHEMIEAAAKPWTPAVGDTVRLKSGGPVMTVTHVDPLSLMCAWMNASNELQVEPITTLCLTPAQP